MICLLERRCLATTLFALALVGSASMNAFAEQGQWSSDAPQAIGSRFPHGGVHLVAFAEGEESLESSSVEDDLSAESDELDNLLDLDLEQLSQVSVAEQTIDVNDIVASLTVDTKAARPAAVTVITAEDIAVTPHRNLLDLINVYVPGAMTLSHGNGTRFGFRGIVSDRNFKYLILVNGRNLNDKAIDGVKGEIDQWNLNDIYQIEIIRGPGSVTYGPGAIGGVISITTKTARTFQGRGSGVINDAFYQSIGGYTEFGTQSGDFGIYGFGSIQATDGFANPNYFETNPNRTENRYKGKHPSDTFPPQSLLGDSLNLPQLKTHIDMYYTDAWRAWVRYTRSGQLGDTNKVEAVGDGVADSQYTTFEQVAAVVQNRWELNQKNNLLTRFSYDSHSHGLGKAKNKLGTREDPLNEFDTFGYSENELFIQSILRTEWSDRLKLAFGGEYSHETLRAPWGEQPNAFKIKDGPTMLSGPDSIYAGTGSNGTVNVGGSGIVFVGDGIEMSMVSVLGEANYELTDYTSILGSVRSDRHRWTDWMTSPRLALMHELTDHNTVKLIWQKSVRMHTTPVLYLSDLTAGSKDPEELTSYEMLYTFQPDQQHQYNANVFYNDLEIVGWNGSTIDNLGQLKVIGVELEALVETDRRKWGISQSIIKQIEFDFNDALETGSNRNGISFSDYFYTDQPFLSLTDEGNDLNNWANNITKLFVTCRPNKRWTLHGNTIIRWAHDGVKDELDMYETAYAAVDTSALSAGDLADFNDQRADFDAEAAALRATGVFGIDARMNASITRHFRMGGADMTCTMYGMNLFDFTDNKLLSYSTGSNKTYPQRVRFTEEPFTLGFRVNGKY